MADGIAGYQLNYGRMGRDGGHLGGWADIEGSDHRTTTHTVTGLSNGSEYRFRIRAKYFSGPPGRKSERATATPTAPAPLPPPPQPPNGLEAHAAGWDWIYLSWNAPVDPSRTGWQLRHRLPRPNIWTPHGPWSEWVDIADADATEHTWTVPDREENYHIQVRAVNASGREPVGSSAPTAGAGTSGGIRPTGGASKWVLEGGWTGHGLNPRARPSEPLIVEIRLFEIESFENDSVRVPTQKVVPYPRTLTFTPSNWKKVQNVSYNALEDDDTEDEIIIIEYHFTGGGEFWEKEKSETWSRHNILVQDNDR